MKKKLLIVDDSSFMRKIMKKIVEKEDIEVFEAGSGEEAIKKFKEVNPDLITMDITMPGKNGLETLVELKKYDPHAKIIMCSSMVYKENIEEAIQKGAIDFIIKPFKDDIYLKSIQKYL